MEIQGKLSSLLPAVTGNGKNGPWKKQEFILDIPGNFPKKVCIVAWGDKIDLESYKPGEDLNVFIDIESREFNGRWYTDVKAWKIERAGSSSAPSSSTQQQPGQSASEQPVYDDLPEDDLPF